jgi:activator of 2-hydroxyglutaryl-CoA dehydratase
MENKVFFSGGLADSEVIRQTLEEKLGMEVVVSELSQFTGAIGAAMIAYDKAQ